MQRREHLLTIALIVLSLTPGCSRSPIDSTHWTLVEMGEQDQTRPIIAGTEIRLEFAAMDGIVRGVAGCNTYSAPYTADAGTVDIGEIVSTRIQCDPPEVMEQETLYMQALSQAEEFEIDGDELTLTGGVLTLRFERDWL